MRKLFLLAVLFAFQNVSAVAQQDAIGLWTVESVNVGDANLTPVAKWFDIRDNGRVSGGNGYIININGTWRYTDGKIVFTDEYGFTDPMGGFEVTTTGDNMIWKRNENGNPVTVILVRSGSYPKGPWDMAQGAWRLSDDTEGNLFMGWDKQFRLTTSSDRRRGIWHINAHRPELKLIRDDGTIEDWIIGFPTDTTMRWSADLRDTLNFVRMPMD